VTVNLSNNYDKVKKVLLENPLSLMGDDKNAVLQRMVKKSRAKKILEIGTFAAGTAYRLAKANPHAEVVSIDVNNFEVMFSNTKNNPILQMMQTKYGHLSIGVEDILEVQKIYENECNNLTLQQATVTDIDVSDFDFVLIDGDHSTKGCALDLETIVQNNNKCNIVVDDCYFVQIHKLLEPFAKRNNMKLKFVYRDIKKNQPPKFRKDGLAYLRRK